MDGNCREIELKFLTGAGAVDQRALSTWLAQAGPIEARRLTSVYFDTPKRDLHRAGYTLRVRREDGCWVQTVKSRGGADGRTGRDEWETPIGTDAPDLDLACATPAAWALVERRVSPLFTVGVQRRSVRISSRRAVIEASLDRGKVTAGDRTSPVAELELELKSGDSAGLFTLAKELQERFDLEFSFVTKAERGFTLLSRTSSGARHFEAPKLGPAMSAGQAFRAIARACLEQIAANARLVRTRPAAEPIHQMRVAARRLRGALETFAPILGAEEREQAEAQLRWLGGELDPARNIEVFLTGAFRRAVRRKAGGRVLAELGARLRSQRKAARDRARALAGGAPFRAMLLATVAWIEDGPWARDGAPASAERDLPIARLAARALRDGRRTVEKRGRHFAILDRDERHRLRIAAKRLRYAAEVLAPVFDHPKRARALIGSLKDLLEGLGDLNDIATGEKIVGDHPAARSMIAAERQRERALAAAARDGFAAFRHKRAFWPEKT